MIMANDRQPKISYLYLTVTTAVSVFVMDTDDGKCQVKAILATAGGYRATLTDRCMGFSVIVL